jgi:hypothetical protein
MQEVLHNSYSFSLQILENENNYKPISLFVHVKFVTHGLHTLHVITEELTKWHIQLIHILAAIVFFSPTRF